MAKRKNATASIASDAVQMTEDEIRLWRAHGTVGSAALLLRALRDAFDVDGERSDLARARAAVATAKVNVRDAIEQLGSLEPYGVADEGAGPILEELYNTFDVVVLVANALKGSKLPSGESVTICPVAGTLSVILQRIPVHERAICALARSLASQPQRQSLAA